MSVTARCYKCIERYLDPFATIQKVKRKIRYMITNTRQELKKEKESAYKCNKWYVPYCKYLAEQEENLEPENLDTECLVDIEPELAMETNEEMEVMDDDEEHSNDGSLEIFTPLNKILDNCFANYAEKFNVIHVNAQSIKNKYDAMLKIAKCSHIHAILVSESFLKPCDPVMDFSLPGFSLVRCDRTDRSGGGVAIYLRSHIHYTVTSKTSQDLPMSETEHLFLKVRLPRIELLLGVFYSPNRSTNYFIYLKTILKEMGLNFDHIIIMGDFNTNLENDDIRSRRLKELVDSANLHLLDLKPTHHAPNSKPSLLDLIIVSMENRVSMYDQFLAQEFLYHHILILSYEIGFVMERSNVLQNLNENNNKQLTKPGDAAATIDRSVMKGSYEVDQQIDDCLISDDSDYGIDAPPNDPSKENSVKKAGKEEMPSTSAQKKEVTFSFERQDSKRARIEENHSNFAQNQRSPLINTPIKIVGNNEKPTTSAQAQPSALDKQDPENATNKDKSTTLGQAQRNVLKKQLLKKAGNKNPNTAGQAQRSIFEKQLPRSVRNEEIPSTSTQTQPIEKHDSEKPRSGENPTTKTQDRPSNFEEQPPHKVKLEKVDSNPGAYMNELQDEYRVWAAACATDLANMRPDQRIYAKKAIAEIIMEGQLGLLHRNALKINSEQN